jgi:hypothetical protein
MIPIAPGDAGKRRRPMPELSCTTTLIWLVSFGLVATGTGLGARDTTRLLARMDAAHQAAQATAQTILDRMDRAAEQRAQALRDLKDRLGGDTEAPRC